MASCFQNWMLGASATHLSKVQHQSLGRRFQVWMKHKVQPRNGIRRIYNTLNEYRKLQRSDSPKPPTALMAMPLNRLARPVRSGGGFTIVELTIATAIFSTVLLVGLASFLGIGKTFYKGVTLTQTQSAAQAVLDQLSSDVQFAATVVPSQATGTGAAFLCIGNARYTYNLFREVNLDAHDNISKFGLLRDILPGSSGCANPFGAGAVALSKPTELLGNKLRLSKLDVTPAKNSAGGDILDLWNISLTLAYGDDSSLSGGDTANPVCDANLSSTQFCSVVNLSTSLNRGL
ncbi:MAG: type II secretion system protein [Patescibacteria group bacterium]